MNIEKKNTGKRSFLFIRKKKKEREDSLGDKMRMG
jgi:hypothetical protein